MRTLSSCMEAGTLTASTAPASCCAIRGTESFARHVVSEDRRQVQSGTSGIGMNPLRACHDAFLKALELPKRARVTFRRMVVLRHFDAETGGRISEQKVGRLTVSRLTRWQLDHCRSNSRYRRSRSLLGMDAGVLANDLRISCGPSSRPPHKLTFHSALTVRFGRAEFSAPSGPSAACAC
jgi:hypothetical protein